MAFAHGQIVHRRLAKVLLAISLGLTTLLPLSQTHAADVSSGETPQRPETPRDHTSFVGSTACGKCHQKQYEAWKGSYHSLAMQAASEQTVLGDFDGVEFTDAGGTTRFFKRNGKFFVNAEGPDGKAHDFEVTYTFGVAPLQQYLIEFPGGRFQALTVAWDTNKKRWFSLYPGQQFKLDDPLRWTGRYQRWNLMCAECHSTHLVKGYDAATDTYKTTFAEISVGCEACHGPGKAHVDWAKQRQSNSSAEAPKYGFPVDFGRTDADTQVDICAACHSRRGLITDGHSAGSPFLDDFMPQLLREGLYYPDGQILEEVYVWGSFLQSRMYQRGVRCTDCHNPHSTRVKAEGNALCGQCHGADPNPRFPTLAHKAYDTPKHHFHAPGSEGAKCIGCHMPVRTYMVVDPRRDHSFRIPRPDLSAAIGSPNACNNCHTDRSPEWAAAKVAAWYGPQRRRERHYGETFAAARAGKTEAESALETIAGDGDQPAIVRATALDLLGRYPGPRADAALIAGTRDDQPLIRASAAGALERLDGQQRVEVLAPLLDDPIRAVRIEAARALASVRPEQLGSEQREALKRALAEYESAQLAMGDTPTAQLNLALLHMRQGQPELAEEAYRKALAMDPYFLPAYANLAGLYNGLQRNRDAEEVLREGIQRLPQEGELHYSLGLLMAEEHRLDQAAQSLAKAAELMPDRARVRYNQGLALQQLGRRDQAEQALLAALERAPEDPEIVYALSVFYAQERRWEEAVPYAERLVALAPDAPQAREWLRQVRQASGSP